MIDRVWLRVPPLAALAAALVVAISVAGPARAGVDQAKATVETMANDALRILDQTEDMEMREREFRQLFNEHFAARRIGQFVLGPRWPRDDADKRQQFLDVFERYIVKFYTIQLDKYAGEEFNVTGAREIGEDRYMVSSLILPPEGENTRLDWELEETPEGPKVVDLRVENISLRITQRDEFRSVIKSRGGTVDGLIEALEQKIAQLDDQTS